MQAGTLGARCVRALTLVACIAFATLPASSVAATVLIELTRGHTCLGHIHLFLALAGLADGLAPKERRYALTHD